MSESIESYFERISTFDVRDDNCISGVLKNFKRVIVETFSNFAD